MFFCDGDYHIISKEKANLMESDITGAIESCHGNDLQISNLHSQMQSLLTKMHTCTLIDNRKNRMATMNQIYNTFGVKLKS